MKIKWHNTEKRHKCWEISRTEAWARQERSGTQRFRRLWNTLPLLPFIFLFVAKAFRIQQVFCNLPSLLWAYPLHQEVISDVNVNINDLAGQDVSGKWPWEDALWISSWSEKLRDISGNLEIFFHREQPFSSVSRGRTERGAEMGWG